MVLIIAVLLPLYFIAVFYRLVIFKLKKINFTAKKSYFSQDVDIENVLVSSKISAGEKSYKYFIGYLYDNNKMKPLHIMLPKMNA